MKNELVANLEAKLFNLEAHYDILKQNYDDVFKWASDSLVNKSPEEAYDLYVEWCTRKDNETSTKFINYFKGMDF